MTTLTAPRHAPPVDVLDGLPVVWLGWSLRMAALNRDRCTGRRCDRQQWTAYGRTDPAHGEMAGGVRVTRWPTLRLVASSCPTCGTVRVHDLADDGWAEVPAQPRTVQLSLFPDVPHQQRRSP